MAVDSFARTLAAGMTQIAKDIQSDMTDMEEEFTIAKAQVGTPLTAANAAAMTDHNKIYVYVGDPAETGYTTGNWYFWNGSAWESGGVYNSTALQTDTTLSIAGMAADAKVTGDDITDLKNALVPYNHADIVSFLTKSSGTNGNITFTYNGDGTYTVTGTDSNERFHNLFASENSFPFGMKAGGTYYLDFTGTNVFIRIFHIINGSAVGNLYSSKPNYFKIPDTATGVVIRLDTINVTSLNETVNVPKIISVANEDGEIKITPDIWFTQSTYNSITEALKYADTVHLTAGTYETTAPITMPARTTIKGDGNNTYLKYTGGATSGFISCSGGGNTIRDITIKADLVQRPANWSGTKTGISITGENHDPIIIDCVQIIGWSKNGIIVSNSGYTSSSSLIISNSYFAYCGCGLIFSTKGEYALITACKFFACYYGSMNGGGNNKYANCGFEADYYGLFLAHTQNDAHSSVVGSSFNHCQLVGLMFDGINAPFNVVGCQFYNTEDAAGWEIAYSSSTGALITSCLFGNDARIYVKNGNMFLMTSCLFGNTPTFVTEGITSLVKSNCYLNNGTAVT